MIYSDKQYGVSSVQLTKLLEALAATKDQASDQPWLKQAEIDALKSQIANIEAEIDEYDLLKSGQVWFSKIYALEELPRVLVQARIASRMSQTDLAAKLNMKPQQVQRYEATDYMGASLARLIEVSGALGVKASGTFVGPKQAGGSVFAWGDADDVVWGQLPYKEMIERKWFDVPRGGNPIEKVKEYFLHAAGPQFATAFIARRCEVGMCRTNMPCSRGRPAFWSGHGTRSRKAVSVHSRWTINGCRS